MIARLRLAGAVVAECVDGAQLPARLGPRPHLHPIRTLGGSTVTDARPADHPWHQGFSVALQDVGGWNLWGGPTFVRGRGYVDLDDHGRIERVGLADVREDAFEERSRWCGADGEHLLDEHRRVRARLSEHGWELEMTTALTNATGRELRLAGPAANGCPGAGYGGFFWRLPPAVAPRVRTEAGEGEQRVHGAAAPWLAWVDRDHTLVFTGTDAATRADPWFVRVGDYPGVGSQLAAPDAVLLEPGGALHRGLRVLVADGALDGGAVERWAGGAGAELTARG
nr:PmoA family protein [Saccharopolyspora gloriosae]